MENDIFIKLVLKTLLKNETSFSDFFYAIGEVIDWGLRIVTWLVKLFHAVLILPCSSTLTIY